MHAAVVGATGNATVLDDEIPFPAGMKDLETKFDMEKSVDMDASRRVEMLFLVGQHDTSTTYLFARGYPSPDSFEHDSKIYSRQDEIRILQRSMQGAGVSTRLEIVPGVGYEGRKMLGRVKMFFEPFLSQS